MKNVLKTSLGVMLLLVVGVAFEHPHLVHAASTITVNSTADTTADDGECTLREAIIAANDDTESGTTPGECIAGSGADTIEFNITGTADFTNGGQNGYTIAPTSALPNITEQVTIDGYSQPGAEANTAISPSPLNGELLVQIDGVNSTNSGGIQLIAGSDGSTIKGLVIGGFDNSAIDINSSSDNRIVGNYIGTDPTGMSSNANGGVSVAVNIGLSGTSTDFDTSHSILGGTNPSDRNLISGNAGGGIAISGYDTTMQGNYVGVKANGVEALPNSTTATTVGNPTVDYADKLLIGGSTPAAANVISGNASGAIQPDYSSDITLEGNFIGTDYSGTMDLGNAAGIQLANGNSTNPSAVHHSTVKNNTVAYNHDYGLLINSQTDTITVIGNKIVNNQRSGISIVDSVDVTIGGTSASEGNLVSGNSNASDPQGYSNISLIGLPGTVSGVNILGNKVGINSNGNIDPSYTNGNGILIQGNVTDSMIGGTTSQSKNIIAATNGSGVLINEIVGPDGSGIDFAPHNISVLGNKIFDITAGDFKGLGDTGLGIDLATVTLNGFYAAVSATELGSNSLFPGGAEIGRANDYLNHPVLSSFTYSGTSATAKLDLTAAGASTNTYRVEFFANDDNTAGQGKTYLGSTTVASGDNQTTSLTLPSGLDMSGKYVTATATQVNGTSSDTNQGFGSTSEFSEPVQAVLAASTDSPSTASQSGKLATTGSHTIAPTIVGILITSLGLAAGVLRRKYIYRLYR
jgi:CSLREA domain-containing protein